MRIPVGARQSPLSRAQVKEILKELHVFHPHVSFETVFLATTGDKDLKTSLRYLDKTDFFTKEVDELVLNGQCRIGIHSAKDLPDPLTQGLKLIAITQGVDPSDVLVLREGEDFAKLKAGSIIATSSIRREEMVKTLRSDLSFIDLRGTIHERIAKLDSGEADGVVVAEAALIRLGLTHLNRLRLPGETVAYQGQLAITSRDDDQDMASLFSCLDFRLLNV